MTTEQNTTKLSDITRPIGFTNQWTKEPDTYDPRTQGYFAVVNATGKNIELGFDKKGYRTTLSLSYGCVGTPRPTLDHAVAELALTLARWPVAAPQLKIVKLPCVFSSRDGWVDVDYSISEELARDAQEAADKDARWSDYHYGTAFERKHGLRA